MALPECRRCGKTDPMRMHGLMTRWFGPLVELPIEPGYFHLCPACFGSFVAPRLEEVLEALGEYHEDGDGPAE